MSFNKFGGVGVLRVLAGVLGSGVFGFSRVFSSGVTQARAWETPPKAFQSDPAP